MAKASEGSYTPGRCFFSLPAQLKRKVNCGLLSVPAERDSSGNAIGPSRYRLPIARVMPRGAHSAPPVLFINGGPGQASLSHAQYAEVVLAGLLEDSPWLEGRELIVFDARGVGAAEPAISCPEELFKLHLDDNEKVLRKALSPCWRRLIKEGLTLSTFNTKEAVQDIIDLRHALAIDQWDLWGVSYGTRVALKLMEQDPKGQRAVMLMGVFPPGVESSISAASSFHDALMKLFDNCEKDLECARTHPDLKKTFLALIEKRRRSPKAISALLTRTAWQRNHRFELDDGLILSIVHSALYSATAIPELPSFIAEMAEGEYDTARILLDLADLVTLGPDSGIEARILYYCNDNDPSVWSDRAEAIKAFPLLKNWLGSYDLGQLCRDWQLGLRDVVLAHDLPKSNLPVLILNGDLDPVTPSHWAARVADELPGSYLFRFPSNAHDSYQNDCAKAIIQEFLRKPQSRPSGACLVDQGPLAFSQSEN